MWRAIFLLVLGVALLTSACGGGDDSSTSETPTTPDPLLADPAQALSASAQRLEDTVSTARSEFDWEIERESLHLEGSGELAIDETRGLHLDERYRGSGEGEFEMDEGNDSEILVRGSTIYLKTPLLGSRWVRFTTAEFGDDTTALMRLVASRGPIAYGAVIEGAEDIEDLGAEDGTQHYRATVDVGVVMNALADTYGSQGQVMLANRFSGPVTLDIWIDAETLLPREVAANGTFPFEGASTDLTVTVRFFDLNGVVEIPNAPSDSVPASEVVQ